MESKLLNEGLFKKDHGLLHEDKKESLKNLMAEYGEEIKRLIFTYTKTWQTSEDLTQEVFISAYLNLDSFRGDSSVRSWLYSIAINRSKDYLKSWHHRNLTFLETFHLSKSSSQSTPESNLVSNEDSRDLMDKIFALPVKYREIIILFYYKELSLQEISELLRVSESVAKMRLHRARKKLRLTMEDNLGRESHA